MKNAWIYIIIVAVILLVAWLIVVALRNPEPVTDSGTEALEDFTTTTTAEPTPTPSIVATESPIMSPLPSASMTTESSPFSIIPSIGPETQ